MQIDDTLTVTIVYALPERQTLRTLRVAQGTTIEQAAQASGLFTEFPEIAARPMRYAVYGRLVPPTYQLVSGDRIELLRPLLIDPKENRRRAAAQSRR